MIFITGDTHREQDIYKINPDDGFQQGKQLTEQDTIIICGDFGCIWDGGKGDDFWLNWLDSLPWTTCFIDGNHENFDLLDQYPVETWNQGKVHRIRDRIVHLMRGETYTIEGVRFFCFGGGVSHDAQYRTEGVNWWKQELPNQAEVQNAYHNLEKSNWDVDVILSHDVYLKHPFSKKYPIEWDRYSRDSVDIHEFLQEVEEKTNYKIWFHGHYHKDIMFSSPSGKPCMGLFDHVIKLHDVADIVSDVPVGVSF